jgi:hypothetical protein
MLAAGRTILSAALVVAVLAAGATALALAQQPTVLSPARFAALDAVLFASLPLDGNPTAAHEAELRRVCDALDRTDSLLAAVRAACLTSLEAIAPARAYARCRTRLGCLRSARSLRIVLSRTLARSRESNRIVELELAPGACRTELRSSRALLGALTALRDGLRMLEGGLRANRRTVVRRAEQRISLARDWLANQPTAAQSLEIFRGVCAPTM